MKVYEIKDTVVGVWNSEVRAMVDTWKNYSFLTLDNYKNTIFVKGVNYAKANNGQAWIVDSSNATGVFSQEIQQYIEKYAFKIFKKKGINYFITINSEISPLTKMTVNRYNTHANDAGVEQIEVNSVADAIEWLKANAK